MEHPIQRAKKLYYDQTGARAGSWGRLSYDEKYKYIVQIDGRVVFEKETKTDAQEKVRALFLEGKALIDIAFEMNLSVAAVKNFTKDLKRQRKFKVLPTEKRNLKILELHNQGLSCKQLAERYNLSATYVQKIITATKKLKK
jgi:DNA-binding NarL/FixJ family response regulator